MSARPVPPPALNGRGKKNWWNRNGTTQNEQYSSARPSFWTFDTPNESPDRELYDDASRFSITVKICAHFFENILLDDANEKRQFDPKRAELFVAIIFLDVQYTKRKP